MSYESEDKENEAGIFLTIVTTILVSSTIFLFVGPFDDWSASLLWFGRVVMLLGTAPACYGCYNYWEEKLRR